MSQPNRTESTDDDPTAAPGQGPVAPELATRTRTAAWVPLLCSRQVSSWGIVIMPQLHHLHTTPLRSFHCPPHARHSMSVSSSGPATGEG